MWSLFGISVLARNGEMTEWLKVRAWKVRMPQKGIVGSNPAFSAKGRRKRGREVNCREAVRLDQCRRQKLVFVKTALV